MRFGGDMFSESHIVNGFRVRETHLLGSGTIPKLIPTINAIRDPTLSGAMCKIMSRGGLVARPMPVYHKVAGSIPAEGILGNDM